MIRNYFLINLLLIVIMGALGFRLYKVLTYSVEIPSEVSVNEVRKGDTDAVHKDKAIADGEFDPISKADIFRPSRSEFDKESKKEETAQPKVPPKLFGTIILNDKKTAILENPDTRTTKIYRINDAIAGYKVLDIFEDKVVLSGDEGENIEVRLRDNKGIMPATRPGFRPTPTVPRPPINNPQVPRQVMPSGQTQRPSRPVPPRTRPERVTPPPPVEKNIEPPEMPTGIEDMEPLPEPQ